MRGVGSLQSLLGRDVKRGGFKRGPKATTTAQSAANALPKAEDSVSDAGDVAPAPPETAPPPPPSPPEPKPGCVCCPVCNAQLTDDADNVNSHIGETFQAV